MIDPDAPSTAETDDSQTIGTSIIDNAQSDPEDASFDGDEQWLATVLASLPERSPKAKQALIEALLDGERSMPLLGLEPATPENTGQNSKPNEDSNEESSPHPLLGTITNQGLAQRRYVGRRISI